MKVKDILKACVLIWGCLLLSSTVHAYLLDEQVLKTKGGKCQIHYLTEKNTKGWYIETERNECPRDKWLDGYHNITVYNAFSKPVEKLYGYFSKGYWTGNAWIEAPLLTRSSEDLGVQKATFHVAKDKAGEIDYIGQMIARKGKDGSYSVFNVCNPFRLLAVTKKIKAFEDPRFLQLIFKDIEKNVRRFCPAEKKVMLFVSPVVEPNQSDIVFYADIDLERHSSKVVWKDKDKEEAPGVKKREQPSYESVVVQKNDVEDADLEAIRQEVYQKIHQINPRVESVQPERIIISENSYQPPKSERRFSVGNTIKPKKKPDYVIPSPDYDLEAESDMLKKLEGYEDKEPDVDTDLETIDSYTGRHVKYISDESAAEERKEYKSTDETELYHSEKRRKVISVGNTYKADVETDESPNETEEREEWKQPPSLQNLKNQSAVHLLILSKIKKQPVLGKAVIHIAQSGAKSNAIADVPFSLTLQGKKLERGWYIIAGYFDGTLPPSKQAVRGHIRILKATACKTSFCKDEK